jgi:hypothetical protein
MGDEYLRDMSDHIVVSVGIAQWTDGHGRYWVEKDYRLNGEVWRVNKSDADPLPSRPHAHCISGRQRFVGAKLHLGTGELYDNKNKPLGRFMDAKQFARLIELIQPKFPEIQLPLGSK